MPGSPRGTSCFRARAPPSPAVTARFADCRNVAALYRGHGLRRALSAADPSDRRARSAKAATTPSRREPGDVGQSVGDRRGRRRPQGGPSRPRARWTIRRLVRGRARRRGSRWRWTSPSSVSPDHPYVTEHPEWFRAAARRHDPVRRESAEEVPGHLSVRLRERRLAGAVGRAAARVRCSGSSRACASSASTTRTPKPFPFWEWLIAEVKARASRRDLPGRGVHAATRDVAAGEARLHAVVHLLHLAQHQGGAREVLHELTQAPVARVLPPQSVAEHARHPPRVPAGRRPPGVHGALVLAATLGASYGIYGPAFELCENTPREPGSEEYLRLGEVRDQAVGSERPMGPQGSAHASQPDPPRKPGAAARPQPALSHDRQSASSSATASRPTIGRTWSWSWSIWTSPTCRPVG